jgi:phospho-N-acetylmuramoyl-pentapeptide-transferase
MIENIIKVFGPSTLSFFIGIAITPTLTYFLYKHKAWKKKSGKIATDGRAAPIFNEMHKEKEVGTPRLGGIVIWASVILTALALWLIARFLQTDETVKLDFISRSQTWIPLATLFVGAIIGMIDDLMEINGISGHIAGGLSLSKRLSVVAIVGVLCGAWFYAKLDVYAIAMPFGGQIFLGGFIIPVFALVMLFMYSGGVIDGIDGLAGGVFAVAFSAYAGIAFAQHQINLAAFCATITGGILAFLWFNIPPARFYMSETGTMALTMTLTVVAFMTDKLGGGYGLLILPVVAMPLVLTTLSDIIQLTSKKFRNGKKVFLVAPVHHHFEALGWPSAKVTMRYWILSIIFGIIGLCLALAG